jgi:hypothetical protein
MSNKIGIIRIFLFGGPLEDNCLPKWPIEEKRLGVTGVEVYLKSVISNFELNHLFI